MTIFDQLQFPPPPRFSDGQQLQAADLQQINQFNKRMREFHNLTLHGPGVGNGMTVHGRKGDNFVTVDAGYGIESRGRELILPHPITMTVPHVLKGTTTASAYFYLTISFADDQNTPIAFDPAQSAATNGYGALRLTEQPMISWVALKGPPNNLAPIDLSISQELQSSNRLVLASIEIRDCKIRSIQRNVRSLARMRTMPHLFGGRYTIQLKEETELRELTAGKSLRRTIETRSAGFLSVPIYMVQLQPAVTAREDERISEFLGLAMVSATDPKPDRFTARISFPVREFAPNAESVFDVVWIGIEGEL